MNDLTSMELAVAVRNKQLIKNLYKKYDEKYLKEKFPDVFQVMGDFVKPIHGYTKQIRRKNDLGFELSERYVDRPSETKQRLRVLYKDWYIQESCQQVVCRQVRHVENSIYVLFTATSKNNYYELLVDYV